MLDLSEEFDEENIATCVKYFERMAPMKIWLEMEIGITGGEEDGVDNTNVKADALYTKPEQVKVQHQFETYLRGSLESGLNDQCLDSLCLLFVQVYNVYKALSPISPMFSIAAAFGNVHGVYKPGNVVLSPQLLAGHQARTCIHLMAHLHKSQQF